MRAKSAALRISRRLRRSSGIVTCITVFVCVSLGMPLACLGQRTVSGIAVITGEIIDSSGAVLPSASVKVTSEATGEVALLAANDQGLYLTPPLQPGLYRVEASKQGFQTTLVKGVKSA